MMRIRKAALLAVLFGAFFTLFSNNAANAQAIAPQTCDSDVWTTMENRARIETEREIMQNQNLIFKADSILDYVCFDSFAAHAARYVGSLFTHTTYWNGQLIIQWGRPGPYLGMDAALEDVVLRSADTYLNANFNHDLLGGRGQFLGLPRYTHLTTMPSQGAGYTCNVMSRVWAAAKCLNFLHNTTFANTDGFYPFVSLAAGPGGQTNAQGYDSKNDIRNYPNPCSGQPLPGLSSTQPQGWANNYYASKNANNNAYTTDAYFAFHTPNAALFTAVWNMIQPGGASRTSGPGNTAGAPSCGNSTPVPTGITVILGPGSSGTPQPDAVCTNPGCTYVSGRCQ